MLCGWDHERKREKSYGLSRYEKLNNNLLKIYNSIQFSVEISMYRKSSLSLRSDGNASNRTVPFQQLERLTVIRKVERYGIVPFPSEQAIGEHVNGTIATKLVRNRSVPV